jgi:hypothetical protein
MANTAAIDLFDHTAGSAVADAVAIGPMQASSQERGAGVSRACGRHRRRQPPKSFVDSEGDQEDLSEPKPLLD